MVVKGAEKAVGRKVEVCPTVEVIPTVEVASKVVSLSTEPMISKNINHQKILFY